MIDLQDLLSRNGVHFALAGKNVKRGNLNVKCPFCGNADPSEHMGISLETGVWGCWRNNQHRGRNLAYLVKHLLRVSMREAMRLTKTRSVAEETVLDALATDEYFATKAVVTRSSSLRTLLRPKQFRSFFTYRAAAVPYLGYLSLRGFAVRDVTKLVRMFRLRYAISGRYAHRVVIPVYVDDLFVTWTSRAISNDAELRYLAASASESTLDIKDTVYNFDGAVRGGSTLFIVEGPIDVWKMAYFGAAHDCSAVALYNMNLEMPQLYWLSLLWPYFDRVRVVLDAGELDSAFRVCDSLSVLGGDLDFLMLESVDDPGDLTRAQVQELCTAVI